MAGAGEDPGLLEPMSSLDAAAFGATGDADTHLPADHVVPGEEYPAANRKAAEAGSGGRHKPARRAARSEDGEAGVLDFNARLADYREPSEAGTAEDLSASQPAASDGQDRSGRSLRVSRI